MLAPKLVLSLPHAPNTPIDSITIHTWFASIITTLVFILLVGFIGRLLPKSEKRDNLLRTVLAVVGIAGGLFALPIISGLGGNLHHRLADMLNGSDGLVTLVTLILAVLSIYAYYKRGNVFTLVVLILFCLPLFISPTMHQISIWYMNHIGAPAFLGLERFCGIGG